jgi:hypothetical protein
VTLVATVRRGDDRRLTKVLVELPRHWAESGTESLWARKVGDDLYALENVPFFAYDLNYGDVVLATANGEETKPIVREVVRRSGHTTLRVVFRTCVGDRERRLAVLSALAALKVSYEGFDESFFALDVAPSGNVDAVVSHLEMLERDDLLGFETCEARSPGSFDG